MTTNPKISNHHKAAQQAMGRGQLRAAHQHCLAILKLDPSFADAWFLCGLIAANNGLPGKSVEIIEKAVSLAPDNPEYLAELGKQMLANQQPERALEAAEAARALSPSGPPTLATLGTVFSYLGEHHKALNCFERASDYLAGRSGTSAGLSHKWRSELSFNLAAELQFAGRFDKAEEAYEHAITLQPCMFQAHAALSTLRRQTPENNHLARLATLRKKVSNARDQLQLGYAIAKEQEDLGQYEETFKTLIWAKQAQALAAPYDWEGDAQLFKGIRSLFSPQLLESKGRGCDNSEPIFIVGMPRTGTTLVQQILAGHSQVFAAGELQNFPQQIKRMTDSETQGLFDLNAVQRATHLDMTQLGLAYIDSTRPRTGRKAHFTDKLPLNFFLLGLIHLALPRATLVCLRRDPMDTCLSNYRQLFAASFKHYQYNLELLDCGRYYIEFDRTMQHWHKVMPNKIFEVQYESLVTDPRRVIRELLDHCNLEWESTCLDFDKRASNVATPSAVQVRQGIFTDSVNRWQRYGNTLQPLYELLRSAGYYA
ncbi:MAG: sulfotransferase [Halioglobus sp.]|nr:sulfotransferase [Halioglobus sp.]